MRAIASDAGLLPVPELARVALVIVGLTGFLAALWHLMAALPADAAHTIDNARHGRNFTASAAVGFLVMRTLIFLTLVLSIIFVYPPAELLRSLR
ncbi:MAG: hypothetical protein Q4F71_08140 [Paracoccus sp. (in: a-proteobacteria)]|nr:hypothetical protein [Paracoccus sp. (in: a-proteobacteria)]